MRSGGEHFDPHRRFGGEHFDPELAGVGPAGNSLMLSLQLAVEVRRGTLDRVGPAGNTLILSLRCRPGGEHSDPELPVEVWRGTL